jgi:hypothetical protein
MPPRAIPMRLQRNWWLLRCGKGSCCTKRCKDTAGRPQRQRTLHWRAPQTSRFEMGKFGAELRPIGLVFPSRPGHAARTTSPRHERGGGAAPGHCGRGFRAAGWGRCCGPDHRSGRGAPGLELLGAEQLGEERHRRCKPQESGFMVLGLADRVSGGAMAMAMAMAESTPLGPLRAPGSP